MPARARGCVGRNPLIALRLQNGLARYRLANIVAGSLNHGNALFCKAVSRNRDAGTPRPVPFLGLVRSLSRTQKQAVMLAVDLTLVPLALLFTLSVQGQGMGTPVGFAALWPVAALMMVMAAAFSTILGIPKIRLNAYDMGGTGKTALFAVMLALAGFALGRVAGLGYGAGTYVVFGLVFFLFSVAARVVMLQILLAMYRSARPRRRVLIYGAGTTGMQLAQALKTHESIEAVAFVDDNTALQGLTVSGLPVMKPGRIQEIVTERRIDRVLLAMPSVSLPKQTQVVRRLEKIGLEVQALPSFAQLIGEEELIDKLAPILPGQLLGRAQLDREIAAQDDHYTGRTVLVSGAGGTIGAELCRQVLACRPTRLVLYELSELALYTIDMELRTLAEDAETEIVPVLGSVTDARLVRKVLAAQGVDVVLHAAACK